LATNINNYLITDSKENIVWLNSELFETMQ
jgi:hypothetical protein